MASSLIKYNINIIRMKVKYILALTIILVIIVFITVNNRKEQFFNMNYTCPPGWTQTVKDPDNGTCTLTGCNPGNNSPSSFDYGPLATPRGYPLNRRSTSDYCVDTTNNNQNDAFSVRSETVGGEPIINLPDTPGVRNSRSGVGWNL